MIGGVIYGLNNNKSDMGEVGRDYNEGLINSERCLQAVLYKVLREKLSSHGFDIFVEPVIEYYKEGGQPKCIPDIFVCKGCEVVALCEIKFAPKRYPDLRGDVEKIRAIDKESKEKNEKGGEKYYVRRDPRTGGWLDPIFFISDRTSYIIAVVDRSDSEAVNVSCVRALIADNQSLLKKTFLLAGRVSVTDVKEPEFVVENLSE